MKNRKQEKIPFWLQITAILLVGVLASAVILIGGRKENTEAGPATNLEKHTVTFAYQDGTIIDTKEVSEGKGVYPPEIPCDGVFRGWTGPFNQVTGDVEVHPSVYTIGEDNLFYFHSVYVEEGDTFALDVQLGGNVAVSSGQLNVSYDPEVLKYLGSADSELCSVAETKKGELVLTFESGEVIREALSLVQLNFEALEKDAYATEVQLSAKNVKIVTSDGEVTADCATINNKVYFLQEVES